MNIKTIIHLLLGMLLAATLSVQAAIITFDDLPQEDGGVEVPDGYAGMAYWANFYVTGPENPGGDSYAAGMISAPNVAFNGFGQGALFESPHIFTLWSMYVTAVSEDGLVMGLFGSLDSQSGYYGDYFTLSTTTPLLLELGWSGITKVYMSTNLSSQVAFDNINIEYIGLPIPEPATNFLLFCGLTGIALVGRRRVWALHRTRS